MAKKGGRWVPLVQEYKKVIVPGYPRTTKTYPTESAAWDAARKHVNRYGRDDVATFGVAQIPKGGKVKDVIGVLS